MGHSRSSAMSQFNNCFRDIVSYLPEVANFILHQLYLAHTLCVTLFEFHQDFWCKIIRVHWLLCGTVCITYI